MAKLKLKSKHRLLCGDSTSADDVAKLMDGETVDAVVSDPPYGMSYTCHTHADRASRGLRRQVEPIVGDDQPFDPSEVLGMTSGDVILWGGDWFYSRLPDGGSWIVWDKRRSVEADAIPGAPFEVCWSRRRQERRFIRHPWGGWDCKEKGETERWHPTQKPVAVMVESLKAAKGALVLDPFAGSGTTLIAAEQTGRRCFAMEISPAYCDVAVARYEKATGTKAERIR